MKKILVNCSFTYYPQKAYSTAQSQDNYALIVSAFDVGVADGFEKPIIEQLQKNGFGNQIILHSFTAQEM